MTQPESICQIMIALKFDSQEVASSMFKQIHHDKLNFKETNEQSQKIESYEPIRNS